MSEPSNPSVAELLSHARWVEELARRLVRDPAAADDLAQATWLITLQRRSEPRTELRAWFARVMRNLLRERARREARRSFVEREGARTEALPSTEELVARTDAEHALVEAVLALEEPHKKTLLLRYFEGLAPEVIARREGVALATVASRITRAHARLREKLASEGDARAWLPVVTSILDRAPSPASIATRGLLMSMSAKILVPVTALALAALYFVRSREHSAPGLASPVRAAADVNRSETSATAPLPVAAAPTDRRTLASATPEPDSARPNAIAQPAAPAAPPPVVAREKLVARIHGRVFRPDGQMATERVVSLLHSARGEQRQAHTDREGLFAVDEVAAGTWVLATYPDATELAALGKSDTSAAAGFALVATETVEVAAGADVEVVLGAPIKDPIRVHGKVAVPRGRPDVDLMWILSGGSAFGKQKRAHVDDGGRYELELETPGRYLVLIGGFSMRGLCDTLVDVPKAPDVERDFAVPVGAVHGRVVGPDGTPVAEANVALTLHAGRKQPSLRMNRGIPTSTDSKGRFAIDGLAAATYELVVSGGKDADGVRRMAASEARVVTLRDDAMSAEVEIQVEIGVAPRGTVVDERGAPAEAAVFVFDERGAPLNPLSPTLSGAAGAFELPALAPGRYCVVALHDDRATMPVEFEVESSGATAELKLVLGAAVVVRVDLGDVGDATIELRDERGRNYAPLLDGFALMAAIQKPWHADVHEFDVPAGNYVASAIGTSGVIATVRLSALAGEERRVSLAR